MAVAGRPTISAFASVALSQTDSSIVAAVAGCRIRVLGFLLNHGDTTASTVTFNTKPAGAGTAITPALKGTANGVVGASAAIGGWFQTSVGEGLTVTTGAGSATGIMVVYELVRN